MMKLDRDDKVHLKGLACFCVAAFAAGKMLKDALNQQALEKKIYECACYVITNLKEYGCLDTSSSAGANITQLCKEAGILQKAQWASNFKVNLFGGVCAVTLVLVAVAIAILIIKPCARYQEYQDKKKIS